jgi:hypothetical protein
LPVNWLITSMNSSRLNSPFKGSGLSGAWSAFGAA